MRAGSSCVSVPSSSLPNKESAFHSRGFNTSSLAAGVRQWCAHVCFRLSDKRTIEIKSNP